MGKFVVCEACELQSAPVLIIKETMGRTHGGEENGQHSETHQLDGFTTP